MARTETTNGDGVEEGEATRPDTFRLSITIDPSIRRKLRLAAAIADLSIGEWCAATLERAADKEVPKLPTRKS